MQITREWMQARLQMLRLNYDVATQLTPVTTLTEAVERCTARNAYLHLCGEYLPEEPSLLEIAEQLYMETEH